MKAAEVDSYLMQFGKIYINKEFFPKMKYGAIIERTGHRLTFAATSADGQPEVLSYKIANARCFTPVNVKPKKKQQEILADFGYELKF